ncbi:MAG: hypothetical protein QN122_12005, partial [Armatimonadota bacterium]|nr:hypothetical protein [Armatimonadota bacterium]
MTPILRLYRHPRLRLLAAAILAAGAAGLAVGYVARPAGHIPPYDANLVRLAETPLQAYCAGRTLWRTGGNPDGDGGMAADCRQELAEQYSDEPDLGAVPEAFCQAIVDEGWPNTVEACQEILATQQLWPTYNGGLSWHWNRARPYPGRAIAGGPKAEEDGSRTGGRPDQVERQAPSREP